MFGEFLPARLGSAAARLGVEPFELVRLIVASGDPGPVHALSPDRIEALRAFAGLETWWDSEHAPPRDDVPASGVVRGALRQLLDRGHVGDARTRQDNLWRGLPAAGRRAVEDALDVLVELGLLSVRTEAPGPMVSVRAEAVERVEAIAAGRDLPDELQRTWS